MRALRVPEVLLLVAAEDLAVVGDEGGDVEELVAVFLADGPRDDVDVQLLGQRAVRVEVFLVLGALG